MVATPPEKRRDNGLVAKGSIRLNGKGRGSLQRLNCCHGQTRQIVEAKKYLEGFIPIGGLLVKVFIIERRFS